MGGPPMFEVLLDFDRYPDRISKGEAFFLRPAQEQTPRRQDAEKEEKADFFSSVSPRLGVVAFVWIHKPESRRYPEITTHNNQSRPPDFTG
jgi:hypothetical protein